jgi:hypothetical protein
MSVCLSLSSLQELKYVESISIFLDLDGGTNIIKIIKMYSKSPRKRAVLTLPNSFK